MGNPEDMRLGEEKLVADQSTAEAAAHAENPFQKALVDYKESLTSEGRKALEEISNKRAQEAVKAFEETKSLEDPRIDALRELVRGSIAPVSYDAHSKLDKVRGDGGKLFNVLLQRIGMERFEDLVARTKDFGDLKKRAERIGTMLASGVDRGVHGMEAPAFKDLLADQKNIGVLTDAELATATMGYIAYSLETNYAGGLWILIQELSGLTGKSNRDAAESLMPMITDVRSRYGNDMKGYLDKSMSNSGFVWSPTRKEYVYLGGEVEKRK